MCNASHPALLFSVLCAYTQYETGSNQLKIRLSESSNARKEQH